MLTAKFKNGRQGFGLIETVIAIGILTAVVGSSLALIIGITRNTNINIERTVMNMLAQEDLEKIVNAYQTNLIDELSDTTWSFGLLSTAGTSYFTPSNLVPAGFAQFSCGSGCSRYRLGFGAGVLPSIGIGGALYGHAYIFCYAPGCGLPAGSTRIIVYVNNALFTQQVSKSMVINDPKI